MTTSGAAKRTGVAGSQTATLSRASRQPGCWRGRFYLGLLLVSCPGWNSQLVGEEPMVRPVARALVAEPRVLIIAHRGDSQVAPENTLPAFRSALEVGVDLVELDYHHSADGVPVVFHDEELDRATDAPTLFGGEKIPLASKSLAELRRLDAGRWFAPRFAGLRLATLEESLDVIQPRGATLIERKAGDAATCVALLRRRGEVEQVVVQAFDWEFLADCRRLEPRLVLGALGSKELTRERLDEIMRTGASAVGWKHADLRREDITAIHDRGLRAWAWTVDDPARAAELVAWGIDGLISNTPGAMRPIAAARRP